MNISECWYIGECKEKCSPSCVKYSLVHSLFNLSELPEYMWGYRKLICSKQDADAFNQLSGIAKEVESFVKDGRNLYIWSPYCGNGKTSWAVRIMWNYFNKVWHKSSFDCKAVFVNVQKFLHDSKSNINYEVEGYKELCFKIRFADLVIWDDLPCAEFTDFEHQLLFQYIDERISAGKANIFTGNESREGCIDKLGDKLTSRVCSDYIIKFREDDKRGIKNGSITDNK